MSEAERSADEAYLDAIQEAIDIRKAERIEDYDRKVENVSAKLWLIANNKYARLPELSERAVINNVPIGLALISGPFALHKAQEAQSVTYEFDRDKIDSIPVEEFILAHARRLSNIRPNHWVSMNEVLVEKPNANLTKKIEKLKKIALEISIDKDSDSIAAMSAFGLEIFFSKKIADISKNSASWLKIPIKPGASRNWPACCVARTFAEIYPYLSGKDPGVNTDDSFVASLGEMLNELGFDIKGSAQHYAKVAQHNPINRM